MRLNKCLTYTVTLWKRTIWNDNSLWVNKPGYILQLTEINLPVYEDILGEAIKYFEERRRWFCLKESSHAKFMKQV